MILLYLLFIFKYTECSDVANTAVAIANSVLYQNDVTLVIWSGSNHEHVTYFLEKYNGLTATTQSKADENVTLALQDGLKYKQVILFTDSFQQFKKYLYITYRNRLEAIKAIVVVTKKLNITLLSKIAHEHDVGEVVFIVKKGTEVSISTYFPFRSQIDCNNYTPITLNSVKEVRHAFVTKYQNYHRCPVKATIYDNRMTYIFKEVNESVTEFRGTDVEVIDLIFSVLNASMAVVSVVKNDISSNETALNITSTFTDLMKRKSDIFLPPLTLNIERYKVAQISSMSKFGVIGWCVPKLPVVYPVSIILNPLFNYITPLLGASFLIFIIVTKIIRKFQRNNAELKDNIIFDSYQIFLGQAVPFETISSLLNSMFVMWIWFSTIVRLTYQSNLTSGLQTELTRKDFKDFEEANKIIPEYGGPASFKLLLNNTPLEKNYESIPLIELPKYYTDIQIKGKKFIIICEITNMHRANMSINAVKKPLLTVGSGFYMRRGWPGSKRLDTVLRRIVESGLADRWNARSKWNASAKKELEVKPLKMNSLLVIFIGYTVLVLLCVTVFIGEIIYHKVRTRNLLTIF